MIRKVFIVSGLILSCVMNQPSYSGLCCSKESTKEDERKPLTASIKRTSEIEEIESSSSNNSQVALYHQVNQVKLSSHFSKKVIIAKDTRDSALVLSKTCKVYLLAPQNVDSNTYVKLLHTEDSYKVKNQVAFEENIETMFQDMRTFAERKQNTEVMESIIEGFKDVFKKIPDRHIDARFGRTLSQDDGMCILFLQLQNGAIVIRAPYKSGH